MAIIDVFTHILPPEYLAKLGQLAATGKVPSDRVEALRRSSPALLDINTRLKVMARFPDTMQVLTMVGPPLEALAGPDDAAELAIIANDNLAELVARHPDKFVAVASLPMNNIAAALKEIDRTIGKLKFKGVQIFTSINDKPLDSPEFLPLYEKMARLSLPIWIHPLREMSEPDYPGEPGSKYGLNAILGWPHATSLAIVRLSASGVMEKYPDLKVVTHHGAGTVPYLAGRIANSPFKYEKLSAPITESLKKFYNDTAVQGNVPNLMCDYGFCGAGHMLFGTDFPMATPELVLETIRSVNAMSIPEIDKKKIFSENARKLLKLDS